MIEDNTLRASLWNGRLYVIRDVFKDGKFVRCEYAATRGDEYAVTENGTCPLIKWIPCTWVPCIEGVDFSDIEPVGIER